MTTFRRVLVTFRRVSEHASHVLLNTLDQYPTCTRTLLTNIPRVVATFDQYVTCLWPGFTNIRPTLTTYRRVSDHVWPIYDVFLADIRQSRELLRCYKVSYTRPCMEVLDKNMHHIGTRLKHPPRHAIHSLCNTLNVFYSVKWGWRNLWAS